jgi:peptidoglycan/LPS O-acetylase OafA/YrhL
MSARMENRIPELDGIRAIAIWMVLVMHGLYDIRIRREL